VTKIVPKLFSRSGDSRDRHLGVELGGHEIDQRVVGGSFFSLGSGSRLDGVFKLFGSDFRPDCGRAPTLPGGRGWGGSKLIAGADLINQFRP
jgi:hypothetical protein